MCSGRGPWESTCTGSLWYYRTNFTYRVIFLSGVAVSDRASGHISTRGFYRWGEGLGAGYAMQPVPGVVPLGGVQNARLGENCGILVWGPTGCDTHLPAPPQRLHTH